MVLYHPFPTQLVHFFPLKTYWVENYENVGVRLSLSIFFVQRASLNIICLCCLPFSFFKSRAIKLFTVTLIFHLLQRIKFVHNNKFIRGDRWKQGKLRWKTPMLKGLFPVNYTYVNVGFITHVKIFNSEQKYHLEG